MKVRNVIFGLVASAVIYSCGGNQEQSAESTQQASVESTDSVATAEESFVISTDSSLVNWKGTMLNIYSHFGSLKLKEGKLSMQGDKITGGSFTADLTSINPLDSNYQEDHPKEDLVGHLKNADFFATESFPTATFVVKSFENNELTGDFTVRGKTHEEKVTDVVIEKSDDQLKATGKLVFDRQKYGVSWKSQMKDKVLSDDIEIDVVLYGKK